MAVVLRVAVAAADTDVMVDRLWAHGSTGIEEQEAEGGLVLVAAFPTAAATAEAAAEMGGEVVTVDDSDWRDSWKAYAEPWRWAPGSGWCPPGERCRRAIASIASIWWIDPGPASAAGPTPRPRSCWGARGRGDPGRSGARRRYGQRDPGRGRCPAGRGRVHAVDIDPAAVSVTMANARANGVEDVVQARAVPLAAVAGPSTWCLPTSPRPPCAIWRPISCGSRPRAGAWPSAGMLAGQWRHVRRRSPP